MEHTGEETPTLNTLPGEILVLIIKNLDMVSIEMLASTSTFFQTFIGKEINWDNVISKEFPELVNYTRDKPEGLFIGHIEDDIINILDMICNHLVIHVGWVHCKIGPLSNPENVISHINPEHIPIYGNGSRLFIENVINSMHNKSMLSDQEVDETWEAYEHGEIWYTCVTRNGHPKDSVNTDESPKQRYLNSVDILNKCHGKGKTSFTYCYHKYYEYLPQS